MGQPLSMDLRARLIAAIDDGMSCRAAAARFGVAPSTAIRWHAQRRDVGHFKPKAQGGDMRSHRVEKRAATFLRSGRPTETSRLRNCAPTCQRSACGLDCGPAPLLQAPRHDAEKKTGHAIEQDRPDILRQRRTGLAGNSISIRHALSLSTRPGRQPTWPAAMAAVARASACGWASRTGIAKPQRWLPDCACPAWWRQWFSTGRSTAIGSKPMSPKCS
jgi:transposase-like protein